MSNDHRSSSDYARPLADSDGAPSASHFIHALIRFYWVLRRCKAIVFTSIGIFLLLGILYYATATRAYQATASLLVLKRGGDTSPSTSADQSMIEQMATYEQLCTKGSVLQSAIDRLETLPPEIDRNKSRNRWIDDLKQMLYTKTVRRTSIIDISCRSQEPSACVEVLNAVVDSYLQFIEDNHKTIAREIVEVLEGEQADLARQITEKESQLLQAKHAGGDIGLGKDSPIAHPIVQRVIHLNNLIMETQQRRVGLEAASVAIRQTAELGGDFKQHLMALEPMVGKDILLNLVGLNGQDANIVGRTEQKIIEQQAKLKSLQDFYGPRHHEVVGLVESIQRNQTYLATYQQRVESRLDNLSDPEVGNMLVGIVDQDLAKVRETENELWRQYELAEAEAIALNDRFAAVAVLERDLTLLNNLHVGLVRRLENMDIAQTQADIRVRPITDPVEPTSPVSPVLMKVILLCLTLGGACGVAVVYALDILDDRFRSPEELQEQLAVPVLAMVRKHQHNGETGAESLLVHHTPDAVESEAFRTLRTALAFSGHEVNRLAVTSSEPSDGKTTVLSNLELRAHRLAKRHY